MAIVSRFNKSTPKNDGLPFVNGRKVTMNHGRHNNNSRRGSSSSKGEEKIERIKLYFVIGVAVAICLYINRDIVDYSVVVVPATSDAALMTIPSPAKPKAASVPVDKIVPVPVVPSAPTQPAPPATTCTAEQRALVLKQLPNSADCSTQYHSGCSFRVATSGCQNPLLARTFFANTQDFQPVYASSSSSLKVPIPFTAVIVRWGNNNIPLDLLRIGSGLDPKYQQMKEWGKNNNACRAPITTTTTMKEGEQPPRLPPQVVVLDWDNPTSFSDYGYKAEGLIIEDKIKMNGGEYIGKKDSFTTLIQSKLVVAQQQQPPPPSIIHYLDLVGRAGGYDYMILMELLPELLQHVRFLHFGYNEKDNWSSPAYTLQKLIAHLQTNGLICYWSGDEHSKYGLWRITDCFLDHYNEKNWSRIQCVSGRHADVQELATRMETQFLTTIQRLKNRSIGG